MHTIPIIRLEVEHMKHAIISAFNDTALQLDEAIRNAINAYCQPENIQHVVTTEVKRVLDEVIKAEIKDFYQYGEGRKIVKDAVIKRLEEGMTGLG